MPPPVHLRPLLLIDDEPIRTHTDDKLNQRRYARLVAEAALGTTGPFTIGVYGGWGQGKTSLLKHAKDLLDRRSERTSNRLYPQVVTVFFNAWRYEREPHPIVPLVATIADAVQRRINEDATLPQKTGEKIHCWWGKIIDASKAVVGATKLDAKARLGNPIVGQAEASIGVDGGTMQESFKVNQAARAAADALKTDPWIKQSLYLSAFDDLESLWDKEVIKAATPENPAPRVVVFVDDLDRCQPEKAFELLEGIKLGISQPGFIFVLALNADIITRYLAQEARKRYGDEHIRLGERYLDKIVQLEIPLRSHKAEFAAFIEQTVLKTLTSAIGNATGKPPQHFASAVLSLKDLLGRFTDHTPRTLIRRLNSLIVDERLLPDNVPFGAINKDESEAQHTARRRGYYMGLLLVQRTLVDIPGVGIAPVRALHEHHELCKRINAEGLETLFDDLKPRDNEEERTATLGSGPKNVDLEDKARKKLSSKWLSLLAPFRGREEAAKIWQTEPGKAWLTDHLARTAVVELVTLRPAASASVSIEGVLADSDLLAREMAIIDREIRLAVNLDYDAPVTDEVRARVTDLHLTSEPITDAGVAELAREGSAFTSLTALTLSGTKVTDAGVAALAAQNSGLKSLRKLNLIGTQVSDSGVTELAGKGSGLAALTSLFLSETQVTDAGLKAIASKDSVLKALTTLFLAHTNVTDIGVMALAAKRSGLENLAELNLSITQVTDSGAWALAARGSALKSLSILYLQGTRVTDERVAAIRKVRPRLKVLH